MNELIKSNDYNRLAELIEQGASLPVGYAKKDGKILWFGCAEYYVSVNRKGWHGYRAMDEQGYYGAFATGVNQERARADFIKECAEYGIFFIDPSSQKNSR